MNAISQIVADGTETINRVEEALAFSTNAATAARILEEKGDALDTEAVGAFVPDAIRARGRSIAEVARLAIDQADRASAILAALHGGEAVRGPSGPSPMLDTFIKWRDARIDGILFRGSDEEAEAFDKAESELLRAFVLTPAATVEDVLLKVFMLARIEHDGDSTPLSLSEPTGRYEEDDCWRGIIRDLPRVSPAIRDAIALTRSNAS